MNNQDKLIVFDGHNDTLLNLYESGQEINFLERNDTGHIDLPRTREGGFGGGFFAIFVPTLDYSLNFDDFVTDTGYDLPIPPPLELGYSQRTAMTMMAIAYRLEKESAGQFKVIHTANEIEECLRTGVIAALLHFEGAEAIDKDLNALEVYYRAGLRSVGFVWSRPTVFGYGVPLRHPHSPDMGPGLTDAGKALVHACNQLGIIIDLSHLNEAGFWDVAKLSDAPLVATHSNAYALCPSPRNLTDKQLDAIKESDGMVGVNFGTGFLRQDGKWDANTPIEAIGHQIDYLVERLGIDRVGFGSDFDGAPISQEIGDASGLPKVIGMLRLLGYNDEELQKIAHTNWLRVLRKTLKPGIYSG